MDNYKKKLQKKSEEGIDQLSKKYHDLINATCGLQTKVKKQREEIKTLQQENAQLQQLVKELQAQPPKKTRKKYKLSPEEICFRDMARLLKAVEAQLACQQGKPDQGEYEQGEPEQGEPEQGKLVTLMKRIYCQPDTTISDFFKGGIYILGLNDDALGDLAVATWTRGKPLKKGTSQLRSKKKDLRYLGKFANIVERLNFREDVKLAFFAVIFNWTPIKNAVKAVADNKAPGTEQKSVFQEQAEKWNFTSKN
jgi:hypothetical protein